MSQPEEITLTTTGYWAAHVDQLLALLQSGTDTVIADPLGAPPDAEHMATLTSPAGWLDHRDALAQALALGDDPDDSDTAAPSGMPLASGALQPVGDRLVLTVEEAAALLGISRAFAYEAVQRGEIPSIRVGRRILVPKAGLERLLSADSSPAPRDD